MDLVNKVDVNKNLEMVKQQVQELKCAAAGLHGELDSWKERSAQFVGDEKMETVTTTYESFAGLVERAVEDRMKEVVKREEWEKGRPAREAQIAQERAAWEAQQTAGQ